MAEVFGQSYEVLAPAGQNRVARNRKEFDAWRSSNAERTCVPSASRRMMTASERLIFTEQSCYDAIRQDIRTGKIVKFPEFQSYARCARVQLDGTAQIVAGVGRRSK